MTRRQLEHVLRASGSLTGCRDLIVVGSQAILGPHPDAPEELLRSMAVDLYPRDAPELADLIDGSIGELSPFHDTFGYYAHGVDPQTAILPERWRERLVLVTGDETGAVVGWCLAPVDLALSKLAAGRPRDVAFVRVMLSAGLVAHTTLSATLGELPREWRGPVEERLAQMPSGV
jgi:hypothetical protein